MEFTARQIADFLKGEVVGDENVTVSDFSKIEHGKKGTLSFLSNPKYTPYLYETEASVVLVNADFVPEQEVKATLIKVADSYKALGTLLTLVEMNMPKPTGIHPLAFISESATVGKDVYVGAFAYIGDKSKIGDGAKIYPNTYIGDGVVIGAGTTLYAGVRIYNYCQIGDNCILHAGAVIGADGFGFVPEQDGTWTKLPQIGNVKIEDNVEIGANTTIDRSTMGSTLVKRGVKIDNLVHLAHNVEVGENTAIAAQCGVAGSAKIGRNCILAGQVGVVGHSTIADRTIFGAQAGCAGNVRKEGQTLIGSPAMDAIKFRRMVAVEHQLPELYQQINRMQKEIEELKNKLNN